MITVIDSGIANIGSVLAALRRAGAAVRTTQAASDVESASALVLPGVGAFKDGMDSLHHHGLVEPLRRVVTRGTPILGICLGLQMLADASEEFGAHEGLGLLPGRVVRLTPRDAGERVPNIGWCDVRVEPGARLFADAPVGSCYFVHSYYLRCRDVPDTVAWIDFGGGSVTAAVERGNVFGTQFHPEKSQDIGLAVLHNYARLARPIPA
jgi:glutamine amidotransferase